MSNVLAAGIVHLYIGGPLLHLFSKSMLIIGVLLLDANGGATVDVVFDEDDDDDDDVEIDADDDGAIDTLGKLYDFERSRLL